MGKPKYDLPTPTYPYKISKRLNILSVPRKVYEDKGEGMPAFSMTGVRKSAINGQASDRIIDVAWPYLRRLQITKRCYKNKFGLERLERLDKMIELSNATCYSKLANCVIDLKKVDTKDSKRKRGWTESDWKKHMDYINQISGPKRQFEPDPIERGDIKPLEELLPRINQICFLPDFRMYKRLSQETWYKNPEKVSPLALKYLITENMKRLATPKVIHQD